MIASLAHVNSRHHHNHPASKWEDVSFYLIEMLLKNLFRLAELCIFIRFYVIPFPTFSTDV